MLAHRGFSAWITVDDEALPEYLVAVDDEDHRVSCWIPGEEGKKFTVWWTDHGGQVDTCSYISLDGILVPGRFLLGDGTTSRSGARADPLRERPFKFMQVPERTNGEEGSDDHVGTIVLKIKRIRRIEDAPANIIDKLPDSVLGSRKAGDLCVGLGPVDEAAKPQYPLTWKCVPYDPTPDNSPHPSTYVSFVFRYRTRSFLEVQGIAEKKKDAPSRRASASMTAEPSSGEKRRTSGTLPLLVIDSHRDSPSPPKKSRLSGPVLNEQTALGHGYAPHPCQRIPSNDLRRSISYYRAQTYMQSAPTPSSSHPSPAPYSNPSSPASAHTPHSQSTFHTPAPSQPTELSNEDPGLQSGAAQGTSVPSIRTFNPYLPNGSGQSLFLLPRTPSQSRVPSPTLNEPPPLPPGAVTTPPPTSTLRLSGVYPYYPYPSSLAGTPASANPIPLPGMSPAFPLPNHPGVPQAFHWVSNTTVQTQGRKITPSGLATAPSTGALSDATTPSPRHDGDDERDHESERREAVAKARRTRTARAAQNVQGALLHR